MERRLKQSSETEIFLALLPKFGLNPRYALSPHQSPSWFLSIQKMCPR